MRTIELVRWRDSVSLGGWQYLSDMREWSGRVITTVRQVVNETDDNLVLAMSSGDAGAGDVLCNWTSIPKACILSRDRLTATPAAGMAETTTTTTNGGA